ncbi:MAG: type V CRISPR-associated endonuclease Cas1 [Thermoguttaceae bacterium]|jgi:CRISPR-associated protein Cas1
MLDVGGFSKRQVLFAFLNRGEKVHFQNDNVVIRDPEGQIKCQSTCYRLFSLFLVGHTTVSTPLVQRAKQFGFCIVLMTGGFRIYEVLGARREGNTELRRLQYRYDSLDIAKYLVENKIRNQREVLNRLRKKPPELKDVIENLDGYIGSLSDCRSIREIMGFEGSASKVYFRRLFGDLDWRGRKPRIKPDPINSILDIGYTLLFALIESYLSVYGFDTYQGVFHRCFYMRKSLVCDLVEPFRPLIDLQVRKGFRLNRFQEKDFKVYQGRVELKWEKSPDYVAILLHPLLERKEEIYRYIQSYYRAFMRGKDIRAYPFFDI